MKVSGKLTEKFHEALHFWMNSNLDNSEMNLCRYFSAAYIS